MQTYQTAMSSCRLRHGLIVSRSAAAHRVCAGDVCTSSSQVEDKLKHIELRHFKNLAVKAAQVAPATQAADLQAALQTLSQLPNCRGTHVELQHFTLTPTLATELVSVSAQQWCTLSLTNLTWPSEAAPSIHSCQPYTHSALQQTSQIQC